MRLHHVMETVIANQLRVIMIPKRFQVVIQSVWLLQFYLEKRRPKRIMHTFNHRYFRAAYDFMYLRVQAGEKLSETCDWWQEFQVSGNTKQQAMIDALQEKRA